MPSSRGLIASLAKGVLFIAPLALLVLYLELGSRKMPNGLAVKRAEIELLAPHIGMLVLGGSEAYQGLSPRLMGQSGYNLANVGQDLAMDQELLKAIHGRAPKLRHVVFGLSYPSLEYRLERSPESWRQFQYSQVWGVVPRGRAERSDVRRFSALALIEPWPALKAAWVGFKGEPLNMERDGWQSLPPLDEAELDLRLNELTARKRMHYHESLLDEGRSDEGAAWLKALAAEAEAMGARPCFVLMPVTRDYARLVQPARMARLRNAARIAARSHRGIFVDLFVDPRFHDGDFADPDHLSRRGAERLAAVLKAEFP